MHVDQLVEQIVAVILQREVDGIINCCTGEPKSLGEAVTDFIKQHNLDITLDFGAFPDRPYDSPCTYGDNTKVKQIMLNA
jgi:dTDP-6-deoxy-L-talose 4-dehydrogenase (NAD+)